MAKNEITEDEYNDLVDKVADLEKEVKDKDESIRRLALSVQEKKDESWFNREIESEKKKTAKAEARIKSLETKIAKEERERELNRSDAEKVEQARIEEIRNTTIVEQNEHTRFRLLERAPAGQRDVFGDPITPVFDLGVEFNGYYGGVYIPVATVVEIGQSIGMLTRDDSIALKNHSLESEFKAEKAPALAKELKDGIDRLVADFNDRIDSVAADVPVGDEGESGDESGPDSSAGQAGGIESNGIGGTVSADSNDTKHDSGKGSDEPGLFD